MELHSKDQDLGLWLCCSKGVSLSHFFIKQKHCYQYCDWICHGSVLKFEVISTLVFLNLYNNVPKKVCIIVLQDSFFLGWAGSSLWCVGSPVVAWGLWDLSSLTRDQTCVPYIERQILFFFCSSAGSSLLRVGFSLVAVIRGSSLVAVRGLLIVVVSLVAEHRL